MWQSLWSAAIIRLGLSEPSFYRLTPRLLKVLIDRRAEEDERQELLTGLVCSAIHNFSMMRGDKPLKPSDFMPSVWARKSTQKQPRTNHKRIAQDIRSLFAMLSKVDHPIIRSGPAR